MADQPERQPSGEPMPFLLLLPNLVTMAGMCLGLTSMRFVFAGRFEIAVALILLAALIDGLDGLIARRLRATSSFGAELDSLSDFLCFGVAPGILIYQFALSGTSGLGWVFVLIYVCCACLRLARFNVARDDATPGGVKHFTGVPSPAGAILALLPVFLTRSEVMDATAAPMLVALWLGIVGALMISRIPTFSPKALRVPQRWTGWFLIGTAIAVGAIFTRFWLLMVLIDLAYLAMVLQGLVLRRRG
ncbi:CDP-diacylglycerol--serine O-phosphatidyltransferase [Rhodobacter veldkampii DSM 11550]|uniref:CDP-diacylglycerol--serine O-phosphatidyltransferase n=1 Tax=Phaeovulum veldkampii DSM 11550 TaxID=1185920 RepID=A0A2T4JBG9_9RHOB|nr:CDP-diacylglycerol--serine O-phosphatidyltransferase [Phaeovulum veldkampii]MBK5947859.1 CDP-diacylglycerol--serine O-phosphatidyltransferase [Phaeovulum veldkampii DSM 11550]NCU21470.1 CDP-diacylglycerol--serine O-phosphatidyltransferase [Candidatus Falkowbacteria bacterium]PTE15168.1 CDP-diacylglycerol--serine O-phosphatidyltransferase [Phaeovulum veldkampii DSM 11550]TDQ55575.1 CDP-diacylglycerol--serine O-phosphatidyltransferase [Phaeovulum veldkampii DSM 11550]